MNLETWGTIAPGDYRDATIYLADMPIADYGRVASGKEVMLLRARVEYGLPNEATDSDEVVFVVTDQSLKTGVVHIISDEERQRTE